MPPPKVANSNPKSDSLTSKEKSGHATNGARGRRNAGPGGSSLKEVTSAAAVTQDTNATQASSSGMQWQTEELALLQTYRVAYKLDTPSAFSSPLNAAVLTNQGIGRQSPTMIRKQKQHKITREQLALAVRKNFNSLAVSETEVIVDLLYKVRNQDKEFRTKFGPSRPR